MRKFYLFIFLLIGSIGISFAQTQITSLDQLSNNKCYTVRAYDSARGGWYCNVNDTALANSYYYLYSTALAGVEMSDKDPYQQFAILQSQSGLYFYSVGSKVFLMGNDDSYVYLNDTPWSGNNKLISASESKIAAGYPWVAADGSYQFNMSNDQYTGVLSNWNDIDDGGNAVCITEVGDFDPTEAMAIIKHYEDSVGLHKVTVNYMVVAEYDTLSTRTVLDKINDGEVYYFETNPSYFGLKFEKCEQEAYAYVTCDTTFNIVWEYSYDKSALPFEATTINEEDCTFNEDTKWYYLSIGSANQYCYTEADVTGVSYLKYKSSDIAPAEFASFFAFVGNPVDGYKLYNYKTGTQLSLYNSASDGSYSKMSESGSVYAFEYDSTNKNYRWRLGSTSDGYLNTYPTYYQTYITLYNWYDYGFEDKGSYIYISEVPESDIEIAESGAVLKPIEISPATGSTIKGNLESVTIAFDAEISAINDGYNKTEVWNANGDVVDTPILTIDEDSLSLLIITFSKALEPTEVYTVHIPAGVLIGPDDQSNQELSLKYTLKEPFDSYEVTGRIHNWDPFIADGTPVWSLLTFPGKEEFEYLTCKVQVLGKDEINIIGWTGVSADTLNLIFNSFDETVSQINYEGPDSYGSAWVNHSLGDYDSYYSSTYYGSYIYFNQTRATLDYDDTGHGRAIIRLYCYNAEQYQKVFIDWMNDNSYAEQENDDDAIKSIKASSDGITYSIFGMRTQGNLKPGLYIRDGRKLLVK